MPFRRSILASLVALAATGCAHGPAPLAAPVTAQAAAAAGKDRETVITPGGHSLGYDYKKTHGTKGGQPLPRQGLLPARIDLRNYAPPIYDQGTSGACTGFAIAKGLRELQQRQRQEKQVPLSALFTYWMSRYAHGQTRTDAGATVADGMAVLKSYGCAPDVDWPYKLPQLTVRPTDQAFHDAAAYRVLNTYHLAGLADVKTSLARGYAVVMGFEVYRSFDKLGDDGWLPMPKKNDKPDGGHAALVVGYDDSVKALVVRNSWGTDWGDKGYFYMPYDYASSDDVDEWWTAW